MNPRAQYKYYSDMALETKPLPRESFATQLAERLPKDRELAIQSIQLLLTLEEGWNGYSAPKASKATVAAACALVEILPLNTLAPNSVSIDESGDVVLVWKTGATRLIVTVEYMTLYASYENGDEAPKFFSPIIFDENAIPEDILNLIPLRARNALAC